MIKILFVCLGNICRSPMAEFVLKDMVRRQGRADAFLIASAATSTWEIGNPVHPGTVRRLAKEKISTAGKRAALLTRGDCRAFDYILGMEMQNVTDILEIAAPADAGKVSRLLDFSENPRDIADPWYTGDFEATYRDVYEGCQAFLQALDVKREES